MRRKLSKKERIYVHEKCGGRCAYCGSTLQLKDMHVDHVVPLRRGGKDELSNMLPACRPCNHRKSSFTLEGFRSSLERLPKVLARDSVTYRAAVRFGLVKPKPQKIVFYFERLKKEGDHV